MTDRQHFLSLRRRLFRLIREQLREDPCCKSYEGSIEVSLEYPNYFEDNGAEETRPSRCCIIVHCYVLGPFRHYKFEGNTMRIALDKLEAQIKDWEMEAALDDGEDT